VSKNACFYIQRYANCSKAWRKALKQAGIDDFRYHDLRHTWASYHHMNGTPIDIIKDLGGWASFEMVFRYAHLSSDHLQEYSKNSLNVQIYYNPKNRMQLEFLKYLILMASPTGVEPVTYPLGGGRAILCATGTVWSGYYNN
jgi:Phage integrase family